MARFRYELEMTAPVASWLRSKGYMVKGEYPTPWGICDLVGASLRKGSIRKRLALGQRSAVRSLSQLVLLSAIPDRSAHRSVHKDALIERFSAVATKTEVLRNLSTLVSRRFLHLTRSGGYQRIDGWAPLHSRIVAVELKRNRVSEALRQAQSHRDMATDVYVALPVDVASRIALGARRLDFAAAGVGVLSVEPDACSVAIRPRLRRPSARHVVEQQCAERFFVQALRDIRA